MAATPRPPAVTMACIFVGLCSFLMLIELVGALTSWGSTEMQDALRPALSDLQDRGIDVTMAGLLRTLRWFGLAGVVLLVAGIVFAVYAVRGDRPSRIGLTVLAVLLAMLVAPIGILGVLQALFLVFAAGTLWSPDARRWYGTQRASLVEATAASPSPHPPPPPPVRAGQRPSSVLAAGLVTMIGSGIAGSMAAIYLLVYGFARAEIQRSIQEGPFSEWYQPGEIDEGLRTVFWASFVILPLAVAGFAAGLALLARLSFGRMATLALSWITAAVGLVMVPLGLLGTAAAIAVIVLLNRDESRAWLADAR